MAEGTGVAQSEEKKAEKRHRQSPQLSEKKL